MRSASARDAVTCRGRWLRRMVHHAARALAQRALLAQFTLIFSDKATRVSAMRALDTAECYRARRSRL